MNKYAIILAAGKGTRMQSIDPNHSKVSYPILGKPIINYVLDTLKPLDFKKEVVVVGFGGEITKSLVEKECDVVWQKEILGTGHAVLQAESLLKDLEGETLIIYGDTPLVSPQTISSIIHIHEKEKNALTVVSAILPDATGYGRMIREEKSNHLLAIREETDCSEYELGISEANTGICVFDNKLLFKYLKKMDNKNTRKLFYLSQLVELMLKDNLPVGSYVVEDMIEVFGINDRIQLAYAAKIMRKRINNKLMLEGVSMEDPDSTYISPTVKIGKDTIIFPNTTLIGDCDLGNTNEIGPNVVLENVKAGNNNKISNITIRNKTIGDNEKLGE
ncbi:MAG: NTP transferase domain-containing protein [Bacilli bacterium]|nr:NTP transferase domain-containing protein [Bacilli bacterium]